MVDNLKKMMSDEQKTLWSEFGEKSSATALDSLIPGFRAIGIF